MLSLTFSSFEILLNTSSELIDYNIDLHLSNSLLYVLSYKPTQFLMVVNVDS